MLGSCSSAHRYSWTFLGVVAMSTIPQDVIADAKVLSRSTPISVAACRAEREASQGRIPGRLIDIVSFSVTDSRTADVVRFTVVMADGTIHTFTARGRFAPNVLIENRHLLVDAVAPPKRFTREQRSSCLPTYAHFEDGTMWVTEQ